MNVIFLVLSVLFMSLNVHAIPDKEFLACSILENDPQRWSCFDNLSSKYLNHSKNNDEEGVQLVGEWGIKRSIDPLNDKEVVIASLFAERGESKHRNEISMFARCKDGNTDVYINWHEYLGNEAEVTYRVGSFKALTKKWDLSTDMQSTFYPFGGSHLMQQFLFVDTFVAHITPYNESPRIAIFNLSGIESIAKVIGSACGWEWDKNKILEAERKRKTIKDQEALEKSFGSRQKTYESFKRLYGSSFDELRESTKECQYPAQKSETVRDAFSGNFTVNGFGPFFLECLEDPCRHFCEVFRAFDDIKQN